MKCTAIIPNAVADSRLNGDKHRAGLFQMSTLEAWNDLVVGQFENKSHIVR